MTLSGGASSGSSHGTRSLGSEGDMVHRMELMRKRRMESNRESAKRSRQRKQQHLDDLNSQVDKLRTTKQQLMVALNMTSQNYAAAAAQNSVLRTQMMELQSRLCALREIICHMYATTTNVHPATVMGGAATYHTFGETAWNSGSCSMQMVDHLLHQCF
ncbi:light-inducible protein CPRF-2 isoform 2 [Zea mays]|uniref:Light-inducible protein CPRF-2 n=2 Tax=Zea mays TaxID=4577 RepID=A0A1D6KD18_MAIZE|nr:light-inducible protein CPRF-2 isoform 2 [Zea mays]ONM01132.1 Light-inducible protein CPRF-2 [Zea mays]